MCQVGLCNKRVKLEFNDISLYTNDNSEQMWYVSLYNYESVFHDIAI